METNTLSLFRGYSDTCPSSASLDDIVRTIRQDPSLREHTEKHRYYLSQDNRYAAGREKSSCPCFAVAVRFGGGKQKKHIAGWTGLSLADFDHVPAPQMEEALGRICADPHTLLAYTTVSGTGIRVVFGYTFTDGTPDGGHAEAAYRAVFARANAHYERLTGLSADPACKNATRLSGMAHDPAVFYRPDAEPFRFAQKDLCPRGARRNGRLEKALATIRKELEQAGCRYEAHRRNDYIMRTGYLLNEYGIPHEEASAWAQEHFADYGGDVAGIIRSCYTRTDAHATRSIGRTAGRKGEGRTRYASSDEIEAFLDTQAEFRHNVITGKVELRPAGSRGEFAELTERDLNTLWSRMSKEGMVVRSADVRAVLDSEYVPAYNPFSEYFDSLPPWDGKTDHIGKLAATVHVRGGQEVFTECFRKWIVTMVMSLHDMENVNHEILVLVGRQGCYKTTWFNRLLPPQLQRYFYVKTNCGQLTKDDILMLTEVALICLEEIDELRTCDIGRLKAIVTMKDVNERRAYAHYKEKRPHIASFCGTTNNPEFLNDPTGNRRWLPFEVDYIDNPYTTKTNYEGVYAQAYALWKQGFHYWFSEDEVREINRRNARFEAANLEADLVQTYYRRPLPGEPCLFVTVGEIIAHISGGQRQPLNSMRVSTAMRQAGFSPVYAAGKRGYRVVELGSEEIAGNRRAMARFTEESLPSGDPDPMLPFEA